MPPFPSPALVRTELSAARSSPGEVASPAARTSATGVFERACKWILIVSTVTAVVVEAYLAAASWDRLLPLTVAAAGITAVIAAAISDVLAMAGVLVFAYLLPALFASLHGRFLIGYEVVWVASLLAVILPHSVRKGWSLPLRWRGPLVLWAVCVAAAWPVIVGREYGFELPLSGAFVSAIWIASIASTAGVGILLFDWLHARFSRNPDRLANTIVAALLVSWAVSSAVGLYQLFFDVTYLNSFYAALHRASGMMRDANAFGVMAALGGPAFVAWQWQRGKGQWALSTAAILLSWLAVWASSSRTAFAAAAMSGAFLVYGFGVLLAKSPRESFRALTAGAVAAIAVAAIALHPPRAVEGPLRRFSATLPAPSIRLIEAFLQENWDRDGYGTAAVTMIQAHPVVGIGVGHFLTAVTEYSRGALIADNAQNWYRHQLVELGLVGSMGWIWWVFAFGWFVVRGRAPAARRPAAIAVRGMIVALALISLIGMPTQNTALAITFWILAFWYCSLIGVDTAENGPRSISPWIATAIVAIVVCFLAGTTINAFRDLRPPVRALDYGLDYITGLYDADASGFQWARKRAVAVVAAPRPWMALTYGVNHVDIEKHPVDVKIWRDDVLVVQRRLTGVQFFTIYTCLPKRNHRVMIETWVSRTLHPRDFGVPDDRELGLMLHWDFVDAPPPDAVIANVGCR